VCVVMVREEDTIRLPEPPRTTNDRARNKAIMALVVLIVRRAQCSRPPKNSWFHSLIFLQQ
jgi:hypothetical protein